MNNYVLQKSNQHKIEVAIMQKIKPKIKTSPLTIYSFKLASPTLFPINKPMAGGLSRIQLPRTNDMISVKILCPLNVWENWPMNHGFKTESDQSDCGGAGTGNHMEKASGEVVT